MATGDYGAVQMKEKPEPQFSWEVVDKLRRDRIAARPEGSFTAKEYAKQYNLPRQTANDQINKLMKAGLLTGVQGVSLTPGGIGHTVKYYIPVKPKEAVCRKKSANTSNGRTRKTSRSIF